MELQLQRIRKSLRITQQEMADRVGEKKRTYGAWERGESMLSLEQAYNCAVALGCSIDEIAGYVPPGRDDGEPQMRAIRGAYATMNKHGRESLATAARALAALPENGAGGAVPGTGDAMSA